MRNRLSSPDGWRKPPRHWICIVLHGSTTGRPMLHGSTTEKATMAAVEVQEGAPGWRRHVGLELHRG
jgi:hypothetical protein